MGKRYNRIKKLVREDRIPYTGKRDLNGGWRKKVMSALAEGMKMKDFQYLYNGKVGSPIISISPSLVSSTFAQDVLKHGSETTDHQFGNQFPGSHINSIGDFDKPESLSKADINAMAVPTPAGDAIAWNPFDQTLPTNYQLANSSPLSAQSSSSALDYTATQMVSRGETTDTHTDIYYTPNISQTDDVITLQAGGSGGGDYQDLDVQDFMRITGLYVGNNITKPNNMYADADGHLQQFIAPNLIPAPYGYDSEPPDPVFPDENFDYGEPYDVTPILRTYNNKSAGDQITFDWEFNAGNDNVSNPTNELGAGDYDASAWVYINGDNTFYKLANIYDHDDIRIGDDDYYQELELDVRDEGDSRQDDNAGRKEIRPEFRSGGSGKTSGSFAYTVKSGDIDSNGNLKMWIFLNLTNSKSESLRIIGLTGTTSATNKQKQAAGKLGKTTDAYNLGYRVETPAELRKLLKGLDLGKFEVGDTSIRLNNKYGYESTEKDKWMDDYPIPKGNASADPIGDLLIIGPVSVALAKVLISAIGLAQSIAIIRGTRILDQFVKWWNKGKNARIKDEDSADLFQLFADDIAQRQGTRGPGGQGGWNPFRGMPGYGTAKSKLNPRIRAINKARRAQGKPELSMDKINPGGAQSGPSPSVRQAGRVLTKPFGPAQGARNESYDLILEQVDPDDNFFQELQKVIVKLKKPEQVEKLSKFLKKVAKAKEKSELRTAGENNSNSNALYPGQPSPNGFPDTPPPEMINGYHPKFGKRSDRYRRLDSISAKTMDRVKTGDPETDAQVSAAAKSVFKRFNKYR